jgi:predicted transcriptional regulator
MSLQGKTAKEKPSGFALRVKMGEYEVEINGNREDVLKTVEELPGIIANVGKAFETARPKKVATLTVKTEALKQEKNSQNYPKISSTENCEDNIMRTLQTDWGKWRPRTIDEIRDALEANGQNYAARALAAALNGLVKKGVIRRWNTDAGFVYILAEKETADMRRQTG